MPHFSGVDCSSFMSDKASMLVFEACIHLSLAWRSNCWSVWSAENKWSLTEDLQYVLLGVVCRGIDSLVYACPKAFVRGGCLLFES